MSGAGEEVQTNLRNNDFFQSLCTFPGAKTHFLSFLTNTDNIKQNLIISLTKRT